MDAYRVRRSHYRAQVVRVFQPVHDAVKGLFAFGRGDRVKFFKGYIVFCCRISHYSLVYAGSGMFFQDITVNIFVGDPPGTRQRNDLGDYSMPFAVTCEKHTVYRAAGAQSFEYGLSAFYHICHILKIASGTFTAQTLI
jgi:hypothetical protein